MEFRHVVVSDQRRYTLAQIAGALILAACCSVSSGAPGETTVASRSNSSQTGATRSSAPVISANGRYVVFKSLAPNLVAGDTEYREDVFIFDRVNLATTRIDIPHYCDPGSHSSIPAMAISETGRYVTIAVEDWCEPNITEAYHGIIVRYDQETGIATKIFDTNSDVRTFTEIAVSADGRFIALVLVNHSDPNDGVSLHDTQTGTTTTVASSDDYDIKGLAITANGNVLVFQSNDPGLVASDTNRVSDVFQYVRSTGVISRLSVSSSGAQSNGASWGPSISADGSIVSFTSRASNLVPDDTNDASDIYVRDRQTSTTSRVSVDGGGIQGNGASRLSSTSASGRFVAFTSLASNLVPGDTNRRADVFVRDRRRGETKRVTHAGVQGDGPSSDPSVSADGMQIAFASEATNFGLGDRNASADIFVYDQQQQAVTLASRSIARAAGLSAPEVSVGADGSFVAFRSPGDVIVGIDDSGRAGSVWVRDRLAGKTTKISMATSGTEANADSRQPTISRDGRFVAFLSDATNLSVHDTNGAPDVFLRDRESGTTSLVSQSAAGEQADGFSWRPKISADGRYVAFWSSANNLVVNDPNAGGDIFVRDLNTGTTTQISLESNGTYDDSGANRCCIAISPDGRFVVFNSGRPDNHVYVRDLLTATTSRADFYADGMERVGRAAGISADGRFVLIARNPSFIGGYPDVGDALYVRDRQLETTTLVSMLPAGVEPPPDTDFGFGDASMSDDGRYVAFSVPYRENATGYVFSIGTFVHDRRTGITTREDVSSAGQQGNQGGEGSALSADGRFLVFSSSATNLVAGPIAASAAFIRELPHSPELSVSPSSVDFGNIAAGTSSNAKKVTIRNTGSVSLPIDSIAIAGSNPGQFTQTSNCPSEVAVGGKCVVTIVFKPGSEGAKSAILRVTPGRGGKARTAALAGAGV